MADWRRATAASATDEGATAVEYAIIASLVAAVIATSVFLLGTKVLEFFTTAKGLFP
ncbi:MAG: Flp family type IVb pilin [Hamadaea sp.]|nr:Flp family type IVb pilin [Hamadaea sp.]NUR46904.1 Flp family type IVb pilin [Hamadaea sp.]NUT07928.1 Flp family type IVb pilin [Hamadaea sp.]